MAHKALLHIPSRSLDNTEEACSMLVILVAEDRLFNEAPIDDIEGYV